MGIKQTGLGALTFIMTSTTAMSHTNSIGYVGDGNGGINFWYGSWHDNTQFNEAEIKITKPDGSTSVDAFNLLSQDSPAGLISGVNYFGSDGTALIPYDVNTGGGESYTWQGLNYANLPVGNYTFTYIPLGDPESNLPGIATAEWVPMDEVIRSLSISLTQNDINGDANGNGILDINEVAVGAASGAPVGPTVVDQGSSVVIGYVAVTEDGVQIVQRTSTTTMWNNMSDGTIQGSQTMAPVTLTPFEGKADQVEKMLDLNVVRNLGITSGVGVGNISHTMNDGSTAETEVFRVGVSRATDNGTLVTVGTNSAQTKMIGANSNGDMSARQYGVSLSKAYIERDTTISVEGNIANIETSYDRTIGTFSAAGKTKATDVWGKVKAEKSSGTIRPWASYTFGSRDVDAYQETGDVQVARSVSAMSNDYNYTSVGINVEYGALDLGLSKDFTEADTTNFNMGLTKNINKRVELGVNLNRTITETNSSNYISAGIEIRF